MKNIIVLTSIFSSLSTFAGTGIIYRLITVDDKWCPYTVTYDPVITTDDYFTLPAINKNIETCESYMRYGHANAKRLVKYSNNEYTDTTITHQCKTWTTGGDGYSGALLSRNVTTEKKNFSFDLRVMTVMNFSRGWNLLQKDCTSSRFYHNYENHYTCRYQKLNEAQ